MTSASSLRVQVENALAHRVPSALTPRSRVVRPTTPTGVDAVDVLLEGGLPVGVLTEIVGPESSGRTSLALSSIAQLTAAGKVCAWVDVSDMLKPESAAAAGIALPQLLWVRCGIFRDHIKSVSHGFELPQSCLHRPEPIKGLHGGGCGTHPRQESKSVACALEGFLGTVIKRSEPAPAAPSPTGAVRAPLHRMAPLVLVKAALPSQLNGKQKIGVADVDPACAAPATVRWATSLPRGACRSRRTRH